MLGQNSMSESSLEGFALPMDSFKSFEVVVLGTTSEQMRSSQLSREFFVVGSEGDAIPIHQGLVPVPGAGWGVKKAWVRVTGIQPRLQPRK